MRSTGTKKSLRYGDATTSRSLLGLVALLCALALAAAPVALAHHSDGHGGGSVEAGDEADDGDNRHPSGRDRSSEPGDAGASTSDPDDDGRGPDRSNGGADKPGGSGGVDQGDQDFNNGCGNDDDFEDDNEGWCGRNPKRGGVSVEAADIGGGSGTTDDDVGSGGIDVGAGRDERAAGKGGPDDDVLGVRLDRSPSIGGSDVLGTTMQRGGSSAVLSGRTGSGLPFTGSPLALLLAAALGSMALGILLLRGLARR